MFDIWDFPIFINVFWLEKHIKNDLMSLVSIICLTIWKEDDIREEITFYIYI